MVGASLIRNPPYRARKGGLGQACHRVPAASGLQWKTARSEQSNDAFHFTPLPWCYTLSLSLQRDIKRGESHANEEIQETP